MIKLTTLDNTTIWLARVDVLRPHVTSGGSLVLIGEQQYHVLEEPERVLELIGDKDNNPEPVRLIPQAECHSDGSTALGDVCAATWPEITDQAHDGAVLVLERLEAMGWVLERADNQNTEEINDALDTACRIISGMKIGLSDRHADWSQEEFVGLQAIERVRAMVRK